jgi:hypothetical protein
MVIQLADSPLVIAFAMSRTIDALLTLILVSKIDRARISAYNGLSNKIGGSGFG